MRPKVKFLTAVWGATYIERFAGLALPSFLASGNLPALAAVTELEVVIMTARADIARFDEHATFRLLRAICPVRFVEIDDLITTGIYGVTLTLAYARPIIACGADMLSIHFVFMNADFVLADGSLKGLARHILKGRSIVLGPSFRSIAESVESDLLDAVDIESGTLTIPPRKLVDLAFKQPHPTTLAKTVNLGFCHSIHPNQFFWQVDEHTVLGRFYLIFMLCLKPERVINKIDSYCDYGFIPELCPSGDTAIMSDSDDFFMLELQSRDQEMPLLFLGRASDAVTARSLDEWTTAEHRRSAKYDIVFHSRDIPAGIEAVSRDAAVYIKRIESKLGAPTPHSNHPYWVGGVDAWRNRRAAQDLSIEPREIHELPTSLVTTTLNEPKTIPEQHWTATIHSTLRAGRKFIMGQRPRVTLLHPDWLDYRLLWRALNSVRRSAGSRALMIRELSDLPDSRFGLNQDAHFMEPGELLANENAISLEEQEKYTHVIIYLYRKDCKLARRLVEKCRPLIRSGGLCYVFIHHLYGEHEVGNFSAELIQYFDDIISWPMRKVNFSFAGGLPKRFQRLTFNYYGRLYARSGIVALLFVVPLIMFTLPLVALSNIYHARKTRGGEFLEYCSSMLIRMVL